MESRKCFSFTWILENFSFCVLEKVQSSSFVVDTIEKTKWRLVIYPRSAADESNISFYLSRYEKSEGPDRIEIDYELAFLGADGSVLKSVVFQKQSFKNSEAYGTSSFETRQNVFDENRSAFLPAGTLTTRCRMWLSAGEVKMDGQCISRTHFAVERRCFAWKTEKFSSFKKTEESLQIRSAACDKLVLSLSMFVQQGFPENAELLHILFVCATGLKMFYTFKVTLLDARGKHVDCGQYEVWLDSFVRSHTVTLNTSKDSLIDNSQLYLPNDVLTLECECCFNAGSVWTGIEDISYGMGIECVNSIPTNHESYRNSDVKKKGNGLKSTLDADMLIPGLKQDIAQMLYENIQCDVKLSVDAELYSAHWFILSARSPVFRAMFQSEMNEKTRHQIDIEDLKPDTVRRLVLYMYTDILEKLEWEIASDLYVASDKYQIVGLKDECSTFLKGNLGPTNACELLIIADSHHDKDLKSVVQDFILKHDADIFNSEDWKILMEENARLAAETMFLKFKK